MSAATSNHVTQRSLALPVIALALFAALAIGVASSYPAVTVADHAALDAAKDVRTPARDTFVVALTQLGDPEVAWPVSIAIVLWLATFARALPAAVFYAATVGGAAAINSLIKMLFSRPRPNTFDYEGFTAFSFPSGHATTNLVLYSVLAFLIAREIAPRWRRLVTTLLVAFGALIGLSRIYLGAHWLSDVTGSILLAIVILGLATHWYSAAPRPSVAPKALFGIAALSLFIFGGANVARNHLADVGRYAVEGTISVPGPGP